MTRLLLWVAPVFLWLPLIAVVAHLVEEFLWPGGFAVWYRGYRPGLAAGLTDRYLLTVNAVLVVLALLPPLIGDTPLGMTLWLGVATIGAGMAGFHLGALYRTRKYSPGVVTGAVGYLPLALLGYYAVVGSGYLSIGTAVEAVLIAAGYLWWAGWYRRRGELGSS